jgi:RNA polymerase sigma factor, sigma-70 family
MVDEFLRMGAKSKLLTREEERQLCLRMQAGGKDGDRARDELINRHLRLALSCARKFSYTGVPYEDLVQEGNIGLIKAAGKFEVERGFRFVTYAAWWVRATVTEYIRDCGRTIRVPARKTELLIKMRRVLTELFKEGGKPSDIRVAEAMGISVEEVHDLMEWAHEPVSINVTIGEDSETELGDLIADRNAVDPEAVLVEGDRNTYLAAALESLDEREREIVSARFGLGDGESQTLEELGNRFNVSRERIRQIEAKALDKLSKGGKARLLKTFL